MRKTKLLTSLAAFVLVLGLGACTEAEEEATSGESGEVTTTDTDTEETSGGETTSDSNTEGGNPSEGGNDGDSDTVSFSGKFDFTTNNNGADEPSQVTMSSETDLDGFWTGDDLYVSCREYNQIYLGNASESGAFQSDALLKVGSSNDHGILNFKFAVGVNIEKVVVSAHSWTTSEANTLTINDKTLDMPQSGSFEELTYEFEGEYQNILSFDCNKRGFVQYIEVYGTYTNPVEPITSLTLIADKTELNEGETTQIAISYEPVTGFDIDTLAWTSDNEDVVIVSQTLTGANATALAEGEAKITAQAPNGVEGSIEISVSAIEVEIGESVSTTITYETIMNHPTYVGTNWSSNGQTIISTTDGKVTDFTGFKVTWYTGSETGSSTNGCSIYSGSSLRIYKYSHFDIEALANYEITSTEVYTSQNGASLSCTNGANATWANYTWTTGGPTDGINPIVYKDANDTSTTITIGYITVTATRVA